MISIYFDFKNYFVPIIAFFEEIFCTSLFFETFLPNPPQRIILLPFCPFLFYDILAKFNITKFNIMHITYSSKFVHNLNPPLFAFPRSHPLTLFKIFLHYISRIILYFDCFYNFFTI